MNNRNLLLFLLLLLLLFVMSKLFECSGERSLQAEFIKCDTTKVDRILIQPNSNRQEAFEIVREKGWKLKQGDKTYEANPETTQNLLSSLVMIKASYIASKSRAEWPEYELQDSTATEVQICRQNKELARFWVGKFSMNSSTQQVYSFFRTDDSEQVYAVEGMAGFLFKQGLETYRSMEFMNLDIHAVERLEFSGESSYAVEKKAGKWMLNGNEYLDSSLVWNYLINIRIMAGDQFASNWNAENTKAPVYRTLTINGSNMEAPVVVRCWKSSTPDKPFVLQSSQFPDAFFTSDTTHLYTRLFKPVSEW
jgi:hypothetical protein